MLAPVVAASACGLLLVVAGAAGAHLLAAEPSFPRAQWDSALLYGFVHVLAALAAAFAPLGARLKQASAWLFTAGVVMFSGVQMASVLTSASVGGPSPADVLSPLIPVGGIAFMFGWVLLGLAALLRRPGA